VHEEAGPDEDSADAAQASPDAPGDAQAPIPDQMPEPAHAEAQNEDESVGKDHKLYYGPWVECKVNLNTTVALDYRMEAIRAWATAAKALYGYGSHIACAQGDDILDRIIELAGDR
jgi:hypothetical protein